MGAFQTVDSGSFEQQVIQSALPVVLEFGAEWCVPCKRLEPELEKLAERWKDRIRLVKVDVDANVDLTMKYGVMSVPTTMIFVNGEPRERLAGFQPLSRLVEKFEQHLS